MDLWVVKYASRRSRIGDFSGDSSVRGARIQGVLASRASVGQRRLSAQGVEPDGRGSRPGIRSQLRGSHPYARVRARRSRPAPRLEGGLTYRPGLDRAPAQPLRHGHSQAREGERVDPGPLGRRAEPGSRKFGSRGGSREPARRGNAFRGRHRRCGAARGVEVVSCNPIITLSSSPLSGRKSTLDSWAISMS